MEEQDDNDVAKLNSSPWNTVTPFSKYLALTLFITLPFLGGWFGYYYAPEKIVEHTVYVEKDSTDDTGKGPNEGLEKSPANEVNSAQVKSSLTTSIQAEYTDERWTHLSDDAKDILWRIHAEWLDEITFHSFSYQNVTGEVIHYCDKGNVIFDRGGHPLCLGENILVIEWDENVEIIAEKDTPTQESLFAIGEIFFNEGQFESITDSSADSDAVLLLKIDELACVAVYADMCMSNYTLAYSITLPDLQAGEISINSVGYNSLISRALSGGSFYWNDSGTKAVYETPCPAGCPDEVYEGFDLEKQTIEPLSYFRGTLSAPVEGPFIEWVANDEVRIATTTYSF